MADPEPIDVPPVEAVARLLARGLHVSEDWRDVDARMHRIAFTVARSAGYDVLGDVRDAVEAAIAEGLTLREFQQRLRPLLEAKGWWGRRASDGRMLGSPRRLRTILDANLRSSYAAGHWDRIQRLRESMPYLRYVAVLDARTRLAHRQWHGTVLRVGDPWWRTHAPPNGWRCRCRLVQLSEHDLDRYGWSVSEAPRTETRPWTNRRTGETRDVPVGIDPGWDANPGETDGEAAARERLRIAQARLED